MTRNIRAHYDGKVIVPDEPVDLPVDKPLQAQITFTLSPPKNGGSPSQVIAERLRKLVKGKGCLAGPSIPAEALRRENLYDERL